MTRRITLPGDIPHLLVPAAPVVHLAYRWQGLVLVADGTEGTEGTEDVVFAQVPRDTGIDLHRSLQVFRRCLLGLDLESPAGQWAAARWAWDKACPDGEHPPLYSRLLQGALLGRSDPARLREALLRRAEQDGWRAL